MPTVHRHGPYRFFFYSADRKEPPHIHVERDQSRAKLWLNPVRVKASGGFGRQELRRIEKLVADNAGSFLRQWHEFFTDQDR